jgi:hypothetical protein
MRSTWKSREKTEHKSTSPQWCTGWRACHWTPRFTGSNPASFGREVILSFPCHNILQHAKHHFKVWTKILRRKNSSFPSPSSSWFATRQLCCWTNQFSLLNIIPTMVLHAHVITWGMTIGRLVAAVQRYCFTPSTWSSPHEHMNMQAVVRCGEPYKAQEQAVNSAVLDSSDRG